MFSESKLAKNIVNRINQINVFKHGIAPYLKSLLKADIKKSDCYLILFDESLNEKMQMSKIDVYIRY